MGALFGGKLITKFGTQSVKADGQLSGSRLDPSRDRRWVGSGRTGSGCHAGEAEGLFLGRSRASPLTKGNATVLRWPARSKGYVSSQRPSCGGQCSLGIKKRSVSSVAPPAAVISAWACPRWWV